MSDYHRYFQNGYWRAHVPTHPRADKNGYVYEHIVVAEKKIGRSLTALEEVHHWDCDGSNNSPDNLFVCRDHTHHMLLQRQQRAFEECGNPDWFKCGYCKQYDAPENLYLYTPRGKMLRGHHRACANQHKREHYARNNFIL